MIRSLNYVPIPPRELRRYVRRLLEHFSKEDLSIRLGEDIDLLLVEDEERDRKEYIEGIEKAVKANSAYFTREEVLRILGVEEKDLIVNDS